MLDIFAGNKQRRILISPEDRMAPVCYAINEVLYDLNNQIIQLEHAEIMNKQVMTSLGHDVRTPLSTLIGYLDAVSRGIVQGKEKDEYIETARLKAYHMKDYVDKLFTWFKLRSEEETFVMKQVELSELTREILKDWLPVLEGIPIKYDIIIPEQPVPVTIDKDAYARIINNLVQNVADHSGADFISIRVTVQESEATISIADNGKGIPDIDIPLIFTRLYQGDQGHSRNGSGLGLAIVKQLVTKLGGTITVESVPHNHTEFMIRLPLNN
jgi:signal transduction histidine kinase